MKAQEIEKLMEEDLVRTSHFETGNNYTKYFKYGNLSNVLAKIEKKDMKNFPILDGKNDKLDWIDLLIFAQKIHNR